jgi:hypothetical protein
LPRLLDNLAIHKQPAVHTAIGATDMNPIEPTFAKLKVRPRTARPRNLDQVCARVATAIERFMPHECRNVVRHQGYRFATPL